MSHLDPFAKIRTDYCPVTRRRIIRASATLSLTALERRGLGAEISEISAAVWSYSDSLALDDGSRRQAFTLGIRRESPKAVSLCLIIWLPPGSHMY